MFFQLRCLGNIGCLSFWKCIYMKCMKRIWHYKFLTGLCKSSQYLFEIGFPVSGGFKQYFGTSNLQIRKGKSAICLARYLPHLYTIYICKSIYKIYTWIYSHSSLPLLKKILRSVVEWLWFWFYIVSESRLYTALKTITHIYIGGQY